MPGIEALTMRETSGARRVADLRQRLGARAFELRLEIEITAAGLKQRQLSGWFRRWEAEWRVLESPGGGATLALRLAMELPGLARMLGAARARAEVDRFFRDLVRAAEARLLAPAPVPAASEPPEFLLEVFETPAGLEVRWNGRTYLLRPQP
jgi:hypothetical protein